MSKHYDSVIIGGSGFIGSWLATRLTATGERVLNLSRHQPKENVSGIDSLGIDFENQKDVDSFILPQTDSLIVLIGQVGPGFNPESDRQALQNIIRLANAQKQPMKVLYGSTALVYGNCETQAKESDLLQPIEPYAKHKAENESLLMNSLAGHHHLAILRLANTFGDTRSRGFISLVMNRLLMPSPEIFRINGDGNQERDYIYIDDLVDGILSIKTDLKSRDIVNIATGESRSLLSVVDAIQSVSGKRLLREVTHESVLETTKIQVSNKHLRERYGYVPRHTFNEGVALMWERALAMKSIHTIY